MQPGMKLRRTIEKKVEIGKKIRLKISGSN
jgi:hypothetical protein